MDQTDIQRLYYSILDDYEEQSKHTPLSDFQLGRLSMLKQIVSILDQLTRYKVLKILAEHPEEKRWIMDN